MTHWLANMSLRVKAIVFVMAVTTLGLLVMGSASIVQTNRLIAAQQRRDLHTLAQSIARASELPLAVRDRSELTRLLNRFIWDNYVLFTAVYDENHQLVASNVRDPEAWRSYKRAPVETDSMLLGTVQVELFQGANEFDVIGSEKGAASDASAGAELGGEGAVPARVVGYVVVALSAEPMHQAQRSQTVTTLLMVVSAALASGAVVFWAVKRWTNRLARLVEASERISRGEFDYPVLDAHSDEIGRLSKAHEEMRKAVQQRTTELVQANRQISQAQAELVQAEKMGMLGQLVAGVAHEINTPTGAIMNVANDAKTHLGELVASALDIRKLPQELQDWLAKELPNVLSCKAIPADLTDRQIRQRIVQELQSHGIPNPRHAADVLIDCGLSSADENAIKCLSNETGMSFLQHVVALRAGTEISLVSVHKIAKIVKALRYYSRSGDGELFDINLAESIDNTLVILQNRIKTVTKVERHYAEDIPTVRCGPDVSQVWTNIICNACDAIESSGAKDGGLISITTRMADSQAVIEIHNVGPPIPENVLGKIFDPFFTTKPIGKGTGLGLSICTGILRKYKGTISARNDSDGVTFVVTLPLGKTAGPDQAPQPDADKQDAWQLAEQPR